MTAFMQRPGRFTALESYRVGVLLGVSFGAMLLAPIRSCCSNSRSRRKTLWSMSSAAMLVYSPGALTALVVTSRHLKRQSPEMFNMRLFRGVVGGHAINIVMQASNALDPDPGTASGIYLGELFWYLVHAEPCSSRGFCSSIRADKALDTKLSIRLLEPNYESRSRRCPYLACA